MSVADPRRVPFGYRCHQETSAARAGVCTSRRVCSADGLRICSGAHCHVYRRGGGGGDKSPRATLPKGAAFGRMKKKKEKKTRKRRPRKTKRK